MKRFVPIALAALFFLRIASAQNLPEIDLFGGYSYLNFNMPLSTDTAAQKLGLQGWDASGAVHLFHNLGAEIDVSGHKLSNCGGTTDLNCSDLAFMFGPRYNFGDNSKKITGFVHGLIGRDSSTLPLAGTASSDSSAAFAVGGAVDYWFSRHIGVQAGPADYFYTHHFSVDGVNGQGSYRVAGGIVFRIGGEIPEAPAPGPASPVPPSTKSSRRSRGQSATVASQPAGVVNIPGRGLSISSVGAVFAPQEFDGAKVVEVVPGGVAEMASLKPGDLIKSVDGKAVRTPMELASELSDKSGKVHLGMQRGDFQTETVILLGGH